MELEFPSDFGPCRGTSGSSILIYDFPIIIYSPSIYK